MKNLLLILAAAILLSACNSSGCTDNQSALPLAGFYILDENGRETAVSVDSLTVGGIGAVGDSLLLDKSSGVSQVYLPFNTDAASSAFFFDYNTGTADTVTFVYDAQPYFASEECGAAYRYHITKVGYTRHAIDSIGLTGNEVTNVNLETIHIFFAVSDDIEDSEE